MQVCRHIIFEITLDGRKMDYARISERDREWPFRLTTDEQINQWASDYCRRYKYLRENQRSFRMEKW